MNMRKQKRNRGESEDDERGGDSIKLQTITTFPIRLLDYIEYQKWARAVLIIVLYTFCVWQALSGCMFVITPFYTEIDFGLYFVLSSVLDSMFGVISVGIFISSFHYYLWNYEIYYANIDMIEIFFIMVVVAVISTYTGVLFVTYNGIDVTSNGDNHVYFKLLSNGLSLAFLKLLSVYEIYSRILSNIVDFPELMIIAGHEGDADVTKYD